MDYIQEMDITGISLSYEEHGAYIDVIIDEQAENLLQQLFDKKDIS